MWLVASSFDGGSSPSSFSTVAEAASVVSVSPVAAASPPATRLLPSVNAAAGSVPARCASFAAAAS